MAVTVNPVKNPGVCVLPSALPPITY